MFRSLQWTTVTLIRARTKGYVHGIKPVITSATAIMAFWDATVKVSGVNY